MRASQILVINEGRREMFPMSLLGKNKMEGEPAIWIDEVRAESIRTNSREIGILFAGRFIQMKSAHLAVEALEALAS
jgi:hypothetical protein